MVSSSTYPRDPNQEQWLQFKGSVDLIKFENEESLWLIPDDNPNERWHFFTEDVIIGFEFAHFAKLTPSFIFNNPIFITPQSNKIDNKKHIIFIRKSGILINFRDIARLRRTSTPQSSLAKDVGGCGPEGSMCVNEKEICCSDGRIIDDCDTPWCNC